MEDSFRSVVEGTAAVTGEEFFRSLVRQLSCALEVRYAFVAERRDESRERVRMPGFLGGRSFL